MDASRILHRFKPSAADPTSSTGRCIGSLKIRAAKAELEAEARAAAEAERKARAEADQKREAEGRKKPGRPLTAPGCACSTNTGAPSQASASIFVSATCGRTPNASLHL